MNKEEQNKQHNQNEAIGIYVHIPFCESKCSYCDFLSFSFKNEFLIEKYINAVIQEIDKTSIKLQEIYKEQDKNILKEINNKLQNKLIVDTIYIGGGTPSFVNAKYIKQIIDAINKEFKVLESAEITIELNVESVNESKLKTYVNAGINRVSVGLQTTDDEILKRIGRLYTYSEFKDKYELIQKYFSNINIDLIFGLPGQDIAIVKKDIDEVKHLNPSHISTYSLILEKNTKMYHEVSQFKLTLPDDVLNRDMYWYIKSKLEDSGYIHYEISNFCKENMESKHNVHCWEQKEYLAYGIGGSSYFSNTRFSNISNLPLYIENTENNIFDVSIEEIQSIQDKEKEYMLLSLRMLKGVNISEFKKIFNKDPLVIFEKELNKLFKNELLDLTIIQENSNNYNIKNIEHIDKIYSTDNTDIQYIKLTNKGIDLANIIWEEFI